MAVLAFQESEITDDWNFQVKRDSKKSIMNRQNTCLFSLYFKYYFHNCDLSSPTYLGKRR